MTEKRHIPGFVYKLMLLAATIIWGFAFVVMKDAVDVLPPAQLIGVRFFLTGLLMAAVFHRSLKGALNGPCLKAGLVLAVVTFLAFWVQTVGLADTTPGKNAFLTATYCVIVPFMLWAVAGKRPTFANVGAAALCITGIGLVSLTAGSLAFEFGDAMTLLCAVFFAAQIIAIARYSKRFDVLALTVYQFLFGGIAGLVVGALTEPAPNLAALTPSTCSTSWCSPRGCATSSRTWGSSTCRRPRGRFCCPWNRFSACWPACCSTARWSPGAWRSVSSSFSPPS